MSILEREALVAKAEKDLEEEEKALQGLRTGYLPVHHDSKEKAIRHSENNVEWMKKNLEDLRNDLEKIRGTQ